METYASAPCSSTSQHSFRETKLLLDVGRYINGDPFDAMGALTACLPLNLMEGLRRPGPVACVPHKRFGKNNFAMYLHKTIRADPECQP